MPNLTVKELCERLKLKSPATLMKWRKENYGPAYIELRGQILYPLNAVEIFEKENTKGKGKK